jgi:hypothetical protein
VRGDGVRVRYTLVQSGFETFKVELIGVDGCMTVGHVALDHQTGRWTSYCRNEPARKAKTGWLRRRDAASFMVIAGGWAVAPDRQVAA